MAHPVKNTDGILTYEHCLFYDIIRTPQSIALSFSNFTGRHNFFRNGALFSVTIQSRKREAPGGRW